MSAGRESMTILMADDDLDDRLLLQDAFRECRIANPLQFAEDGEQLIDYLHGRGRWLGQAPPRPGLILLDLNMPRMDGRTALAEIRADPLLRHIPVVVFSTSNSVEDVLHAYRHGANSFVSKPDSYAGLMAVVQTLARYWLHLVQLPAPA